MLNKAEKNYSQCMLELGLLGIKNDKDCESLKKVNDENNSLKIECDSLKSALDAMKSSNDSDKKQINVVMDELNKVIGEKCTLKRELDSINNSLESMRKSYDSTCNLLTATKKDLNSAFETIEKVEKEKSDLVDKVKENDTLRDQLKRVSSEAIVQNKTLSKLTAQVAALETQLKQYDTPSTHVKTIMNKTLGELAEKVAPVPDVHSPENEEWEILESTSDFESVEKSDATM
jgi:chromosome segregation ATPase